MIMIIIIFVYLHCLMLLLYVHLCRHRCVLCSVLMNFVWYFDFVVQKVQKLETRWQTVTDWLKQEIPWRPSEKVRKKGSWRSIHWGERKGHRFRNHNRAVNPEEEVKSLVQGIKIFNMEGGGMTPWHPNVLKIRAVQFQINQERLGIRTPRKTDQEEWGTFISNASKYTSVGSYLLVHIYSYYFYCTVLVWLSVRVFFLVVCLLV